MPKNESSKAPRPRTRKTTAAKRTQQTPLRQAKSAITPRSATTERRLAELKARLGEIADLNAASAVLGWDQATYMPKGGAVARGRQAATLNRIVHEKFTDAALGRLIEHLSTALADQSPDDDDAALVRVTRRDYEAAIKVPATLVERISIHSNAAYMTWTRARPANDFEMVAPFLLKGVELGRELSRALGPGAHVMDRLIDSTEPGMSVAETQRLFDALREPLRNLLGAACAARDADIACLQQHFPEAKQLVFGLKMAEHFGFDLTRGRQDISPHPFCTSFSSGDVRITTRVRANDLGEALYSTLHEAGHALYEQGVSSAFDRSRLAGGASPGIHESQSRLWENIVGRSEKFLGYAYPLLQRQFSEQLRRIPFKTFYRAVNRVAPSLIRTDADELTYNLHIMIRFDLECQLLEGRLAVRDLPEAWAERYAHDLGVKVPNHSDGCLQDVHWFGGPIGGAFQSYTIGNILSAQFYDAAVAKFPAIPDEIGAGKFSTLHGWLTDNVYRHGRKYDPADLVRRATGQPISVTPYLDYLSAKYGAPETIQRPA